MIRKKFVILTPEEWVRQHFIHFLIAQQYPKSLLKIEGGLIYNELQKRSDIVVYDRQARPWMVVECKNPLIAMDDATVSQVAVYNVSLKARYIAVTNGLSHLYFQTDWENNEVKRLEALPLLG